MVKFVTINYENNGKRSLPKADNNYDFALIKAVKNNDSVKFTNVCFGMEIISLKPGDNPVQRPDLLDEDEKSLIMIAVEKAINNPEYIEGILKTLIENEYQSNILDATNRTPLHVASAAGNKVIVEKLLATRMLNIDKHHSDHGTALFAAIKNGHLDIAELLLTKGADINIQLFPIEDLIEKNDIETLKYFIKLSTDNISAINNKTPILKSSDFNKFSEAFNEQLFNNNNIKLAAQNEQSTVFELLIEQFITNQKTLALKSAIHHEPKVRSMIFDCLQKDKKLLDILLEKGDLIELFLKTFINDQTTTPGELEIILKRGTELLNEGNSQNFTLIIKNITKEFIQKYSNKESDNKSKIEALIKAMISNTVKFGNNSDFDNLLSIQSNEFSETIKKQLLEYSALELTVQHDNSSIIDSIVQHILVHSDVQAVKNLLHIATSNMKKHVFNEKIMQEDNFQKFSKHFKE